MTGIGSKLGWVVAVPLGFALLGALIRLLAVLYYLPEAGVEGYFDALCRWDCGWYLFIAESGYDPYPNVPKLVDGGNWAFFPLYPVLIGLLIKVISLPTIVVASVTSMVLAVTAAVASYPLFNGNKRAYVLFSAFLLCGPVSVYFSTSYTEVMFVLLTICVFVALQRHNYLAAGLFGALLSATRIVGVFIVFAILVQSYMDHRARGGTLKGFVTGIWTDTDLLLALFIAPLGLFAYMAYLHFHMGDALAFAHVQVAWARQAASPLAHWWHAMTSWPGPGSGALLSSTQYLALAVAAGYVLIGVLFVRRQYGAAVFCVICLTLPLFTGLASMLRFVTALAPLMILLMQLLSRPRLLFAATLACFLVLDFVLTGQWIHSSLVLV